MSVQIALPNPSGERRYLDLLEGSETWLQRKLVRGGLAKYEPETLATLLALVHTRQADGAFLDVGAHFGLYAAVVERMSEGRLAAVHAFEPTPDTFAIGSRIRAANDLRFGYHRVAVSNVNGEALLYLSNTSDVTNSLVPGFRRARDTLPVTTRRLDDLVTQLDVAPSILKIDVECNEVPVLEGALRLIERHRPSLVVEVLERHHEPFLSTSVWLRLQAIGYRYYHIHPAVPWRNGRRNALYPRSRDLLLVPKRLNGDFWLNYMGWRWAIAECTHKLHRTCGETASSAVT